MLFFYVEALHNHSNYKLNLNKEKLIGAWLDCYWFSWMV